MSIADTRATAPFDELAATVSGAVVLTDHPNWDIARAAWNLAVDQRPCAVVVPRDAEDVATVVGFAAEHGLRLAAQGTGHQAAALGDLRDTILVHTSALTGVEVDVSGRSVRAGAGEIWATITAALSEHGLVGLSGSAADVGIVGYSLGGGYSWLGREHGLAASSVTAIELVTGDGRIRRVDADTDPDLFWALRGGGGNFGVVTAVEFDVFEIADVYAGMMLFPLELAGDLLRTFEEQTRDLDERATLCARVLHLPPMPELPQFLRGKAFAAIDGAINALDDEADALLAPFAALGPVINTFGRMPAGQLAQIHMDPPQPAPAKDDGFVLDDLPSEAIAAILASAGPGVNTPLLLIDLRLLGGALGRPDPRGGAVNRIEGRFLLNAVGIAPNAQAHAAVAAAVDALRSAMEPWHASLDYANFCDSGVGPEHFYSPDVLERLRSVKHAYDAQDIIRACHELNA